MQRWPITQTESILLSELSKKAPFSAKYLNFLVRKGALKAHKDGPNWHRSIEAVEEYKKTRLRKHD